MTDLETVRYTYRLRPGVQAERALIEEWHRCRWLWNEAVHQDQSGNRPTLCRLSKLLTEARACSFWLRSGARAAQKQTLRDYAMALDHSFTVRGRRRPVFKKRKVALPTLGYAVGGFALKSGRLVLAKGITIPVVWSRDLPSKPSSVRVYQDALGHWYASFVVARKVEPAARVDGAIGIDWGVRTTAIATDPAYDLPHGEHRKRCAAELAKAQRRMARRERSSRGYRAARRQAAKLHKKAARQTNHDARIWARRVVADHDLIAVEDFKPRFLSRSTMARKAADAAIGTTKRLLIEYGTRAGRAVVLVPPAFTTMTCSRCGEKQARLDLAERTFRCADCGHTADRDRNAARVILATAERDRDGADDVRPSTSRSGMLAGLSEPGIPNLGGSNGDG